MRLNRRQKIKLVAGIVWTLYVLFGLGWMGLDISVGSKAALILSMWLVVAAAMYYRRDRD